MGRRRTVQKRPSKGQLVEYVVKGAILKCDQGTKTAELKPSRRTAYIQGKVKANILDFKPMYNIPPFGCCKRKKMKPC
ncbi:MAG TPA: PAAR-like protein, partial [Bacillota bacterium]|nr:PAAR-like protein [Bacillota bacterium]